MSDGRPPETPGKVAQRSALQGPSSAPVYLVPILSAASNQLAVGVVHGVSGLSCAVWWWKGIWRVRNNIGFRGQLETTRKEAVNLWLVGGD